MAGEVVAPAVRVLDYGWQAPNPIDYQHAALAGTEPIQRAVSEGVASRNQFLLAELNNARAMQMAKWQHEAQIQREKMRDDRMLAVADKRAQAQLNAMKEKGMLDDLKNKSTYLTSRLGGNPVARMAGESDEAYGARIDSAIKDKLKENITADTNAAYNIKKQIASYNQYVSDPKVNQAVQSEMSAAVNDPNVQAQARNYVTSNLSSWLQTAAGDKASAVMDEAQKNPAQLPQILQKYGLAQQYNDFVASARQTAAYGYLKATGSPAMKQFATANENLKILGQQLQNLSTMPGDNGRMVPKPWWSQVQNSVGDMELHDAQVAQEQQQKVTNPFLPPKPQADKTTQRPASPLTPPAVNPADFDAQGASVNTAPLAGKPGNTLGFGAWDQYGATDASGYTPTQSAVDKAVFGPRTSVAGWTDRDIATAEAANPGFWNGMISAPGYWARQVGSMFDSRINPNNAFTPAGNASFAPLPLPSRARPMNPVVAPMAAPVAAPAAVPVAGPMATNVVQAPAMPMLQAVPAGAQFSPFTGIPMTPASPQMDYQDPYAQVSQMMAMKAMYGQ